MTANTPKKDNIDDVHVSSSEHQSSHHYYESFISYKEIINSLPSKLLKDEDQTTLYALFKQINTAKKGNTELFRRLSTADTALCALWLSKVKFNSDLLSSFNKIPQFQGFTSGQMTELSKLSVDVHSLSSLPSILLSHGIILLYEKSLPGMKMDGAVFLTGTKNPVIAMSLRYPRLDYFWFTLMHELAHVVLHSDLLVNPILDDFDEQSTDKIEREADKLALNAVIPKNIWRNCEPKYKLNDESIVNFSKEMGVHPSIVAGRLSRELGKYHLFSDLRNSFNVREALFGHD